MSIVFLRQQQDALRLSGLLEVVRKMLPFAAALALTCHVGFHNDWVGASRQLICVTVLQFPRWAQHPPQLSSSQYPSMLGAMGHWPECDLDSTLLTVLKCAVQITYFVLELMLSLASVTRQPWCVCNMTR